MKRSNLMMTMMMICTVALIGCGGADEQDDAETAPSKADIAAQLAAGKADAMTDWCAEYDWYDDGICDDFCLQPDPDCEDGDYDPCDGLSCGEQCTICEPSDPNCFETAVIKVCQPDGACAASVPVCGGDDDTDNNDDGGDDSYEPCGGLSCGDTCTVCDPNDPDCYETAVIKMCQPDGTCEASVPDCDGDGGDDYDPCEGLACGESCSLCAPGDADCYETAVLKFCQADGTCQGVEPDSCDRDGTYDPCAGLSCGDTCTLCDPNDADCFETAVVKQCNDEGTCSAASAVCM